MSEGKVATEDGVYVVGRYSGVQAREDGMYPKLCVDVKTKSGVFTWRIGFRRVIEGQQTEHAKVIDKLADGDRVAVRVFVEAKLKKDGGAFVALSAFEVTPV